MFTGASGSYSDSDPEVFYPYYCPPPPEAGKVVGSAGLARMRFSSGSLQLDEEDEVEEEERAQAAAKKETKSDPERTGRSQEGEEEKGAVKITQVTL